MTNAVIEEYQTSLDDLTFNSKPHINALTMLAEEYLPHAEHIVHLIEAQLNKAQPVTKLPLMYLMDSVVKNVGGNYTPLFAKNLVKNFYGTFETGDEKTKICLHKLRSTWDNYFPLRKLHELDVLVHSVDPNWPVKPLPANLQDKPSTSIHVNPKFLKKAEGQPVQTNIGAPLSISKTGQPAVKDSVDLKQDLINKQKQLLELQQQKLLLELEQTKQQLALREKRNQSTKKQNDSASRDPRTKSAAPMPQSKMKVTLTNGQTKMQAGSVKDPRSLVTRQKVQPKAPSVAVKKEASEDEQLRAKLLDAQKKSPKKLNDGKLSESGSNSASKRSMQKSPTSGGKTKSTKVTSPKPLITKSSKKKGSKKKVDNIQSKKSVGENLSRSSKPTEMKESSERKSLPNSQDGAKVKKRDRPPRRSPSHGAVPPAKQARRSTSIERARVPATPPKRGSTAPTPDVVESAHSEFNSAKSRDPRRIRERSLSPRFSPEPDELPRRGRNWQPAAPVEATWPAEEEQGLQPPLVRRRPSIDPNLRIPQELTLSHQAEILKQAEVQLQTGQLTHEQHQELLKQLHQLFELQRLRNTQMMDQVMVTNRHPFEADFVMHGNEEGRLLGSGGGGSHRSNAPFQSDDHHGPVFHPPPSPPQMSDGVRREDFNHGPPPQRAYGPRMDRPLRPQNRPLPPRDSSSFDHQKFTDSRHTKDRLESRGPSHDRRFAPRHGPRRRNGRGRIGRMQDIRRSDGRANVIDSGPYVYDEEEFTGQYRGRKESPVREEPFFSGPYSDRISSDRPRSSAGGAKQRKHTEKGESNRESKKLALRVYASPEPPEKHGHAAQSDEREDAQKWRGPSDDPEERKSARRPTSPKIDKEVKAEQADDEDKAPLFEEPEDYIIASIPPEAEVYNKHFMSLNRRKSDADRAYTEHKKNILCSAYTKQLASENEYNDTGESSALVPSNDDVSNTEESLGSPDALKKEKVEEDVNRSPSLPLKKRKYLVSASDFNAGEAQADLIEGMVTQSEQEPTDQRKEELAEEAMVSASESKVNLQQSARDDVEMQTSDVGDDVKMQPPGDIADDVEMQPSEEATETQAEDENKSETPLTEKVPTPDDTTAALTVEVASEENASAAEKELPKRKKSKMANLAKKGQQVEIDGGDDAKQFDAKLNKRRELSKEKDRKEKFRRRDWGKGMRRPHDNAEMYDQMQEDRLRSLYLEEERRLEWELELQKRLEIPEREQDMDGRRPPDMVAGPQRGGRLGMEGGPWDRRRGRFVGRRGRGRNRWGRMKDEHAWDEETADPEMFPDGVPYPGRRVPPHDRLLPPPHERRAIMRERMRGGRGWPGPYRPHPDGRDRPWNEVDMDRPRSGPPHERIAGPHPPYHPDDRLSGLAGRPGFSGRSPGREEPYAPAMQEAQRPSAEMNQVNVNKLLQDLLTMGIIPGNKPVTGEKTASGPPSRNNSPAPAVTDTMRKDIGRSDTPPVGTAGVEVQAGDAAGDARHILTPVFHEEDLVKMNPDESIPEITFDDMDKLKIRCNELINRLYTGIQCSACGMRFTARQTDIYAEHLDWHYRINRKDRDGVKDTHRSLYPTAGEWIMYEEIADPSQLAPEQLSNESEGQPGDVPEPENPEDLVVPVKGLPGEDKCAVCHEAFKTVYNDEDDEWQYVNCVTVDDKNFHPSCYADHNDSSDLAPLPTPTRVPLYNPIENLKGIPGLDSLQEKEGSNEETELEKKPVTHEGEVTSVEEDNVPESESPEAPAEDNSTDITSKGQLYETDDSTGTTPADAVEEEPGQAVLMVESSEAPIEVDVNEEPVQQMEDDLEKTDTTAVVAGTDTSERAVHGSLPPDGDVFEVSLTTTAVKDEAGTKEESSPMEGIETAERPSSPPDIAASADDLKGDQPQKVIEEDLDTAEECIAGSTTEAEVGAVEHDGKEETEGQNGSG